MTKQEITNLINKTIKGQGSQVDTAGALPSILSAILELIPDYTPSEFSVTIEETGTTEGRVTTYDVTNSQESIDAFIAGVESDSAKALMVVRDGDLLIRFEQIEVSDTTVSGIAVIGSGVYSLHLNSTEAGGDSYFSYTANEAVRGMRIFSPIADWEAETISLGDAVQKYGLTDAIWAKLLNGEISATTRTIVDSGTTYEKILATTVIDTDVDPALAYENGVHFGSALSIKKTADGNFIIAFS